MKLKLYILENIVLRNIVKLVGGWVGGDFYGFMVLWFVTKFSDLSAHLIVMLSAIYVHKYCNML